MSIVEQILAKSQFVETIDGLEFRLRVVTAETSARVIGNKVLGMMRSGKAQRDMPQKETDRIARGYLSACMVSPALGDVSSVEDDTISLEDLGTYAGKILAAVFEKSGFDELENLGESSEGTEEES